MTARTQLPIRLVPPVLVGIALPLGLVAGVDPKLALVGAMALAFVTLVMSDLAIGVTLFAVISFLDVLPFGGVAVSIAKVTGAVLALSWLALIATRPDTENDFLVSHPMFSYLLLAFLAWGAVSASWAENSGMALE